MKKVKKMAPKKVVRPNGLFPGEPNYRGPNKGWFAFVHHGALCEHTGQFEGGIRERVAYIKTDKPRHERQTRLRHLIYLGRKLNAQLTKVAKDRGLFMGSHSCRNMVQRHGSTADLHTAVMLYVTRRIKPFCWNGHSLTDENGFPFTGF